MTEHGSKISRDLADQELNRESEIPPSSREWLQQNIPHYAEGLYQGWLGEQLERMGSADLELHAASLTELFQGDSWKADVILLLQPESELRERAAQWNQAIGGSPWTNDPSLLLDKPHAFQLSPTSNSPEGSVASHLSMTHRDGEYARAYKSGKEGRSDQEFTKFVDGLTGEERWLDLGTGMGTPLVSYLEQNEKIHTIVKLDLDIDNLLARTRYDSGLVNADAAALPLGDNSVDIAVSYLMSADNVVTSHVKREAIRRELIRVIKPGGIFITSSGERALKDIEGFELAFTTGSPTYDHFYRRRGDTDYDATRIQSNGY